ncbi:MAG: hypothetical protein ACRCUH_05190 [Shewanella sp.]
MEFIRSSRRFKLTTIPVHSVDKKPQIHHGVHLTLTLITMGLWAGVWCWVVLSAYGEAPSLFSHFEDDYWRYLIEREQPPASLYSECLQLNYGADYFEA